MVSRFAISNYFLPCLSLAVLLIISLPNLRGGDTASTRSLRSSSMIGLKYRHVCQICCLSRESVVIRATAGYLFRTIPNAQNGDTPFSANLSSFLLWVTCLVPSHDDVPTTHLLQYLCCFGSILALGAYLRSVLVEKKWERQAPKRQECRNGARPLISKVLVHLCSKEGKGGAKKGPNH